jgi:pyridoxine 5-phosphate synthase
MAKNKSRLGVNIDHVATLRQQRGEAYPSLVEAAEMACHAGADQITIHLREDRRHIQDYDSFNIIEVTKKHNKLLNFEMGCAKEIIEIARELKPDWVCLVPEKREEKTTEGGLNLKEPAQFEKIEATMKTLYSHIPGLKISLFVEADHDILDQCIKLKPEAVEIHTGDYAIDVNEGNDIQMYLERYQKAHQQMINSKISFHAGHGLTHQSLVPLVRQNLFSEYNIGHWIICDAIFNGLENSVQKLLKIINQ